METMTGRQVQEIIARCVGIVVSYHHGGRCEASSRRMVDDVQAVRGEVLGLGLSPDEMEGLLIRPVSGELIARYGHELGPRLNAEFLAAFDGLIPPRPDHGMAGDGLTPRLDHPPG